MTQIMTIVYLVLGGIAGGGIGWLATTLVNKIKMAQMEKELAEARLRVNEVIEELAIAKDKIIQTSALLADTLAAIEVMKAYEAIDKKTRENMDKLKESFDNGTPTDDTYSKYRDMIKKINERNGYEDSKVEEEVDG